MSRFFHAFMLLVFLSFPTLAEEGPSPEDVAFVQSLLIRFGYDPGPIDGICGDLTTAAVRSFHEDRNLPLKAGRIEPQAATVVANLTSEFAENVIEPKTPTPTIYEKALDGDAEAAFRVGMMYHQGEAVAFDGMMAYAWWTVAETLGKAEAAGIKADLLATGGITPHEIGYATSLAETIIGSAAADAVAKPEKTGPVRQATM